MRGKKRPPLERAHAMGIALVNGVPAASEATGIPERTIRLWQESEEYAELRQRTKEQVSDEWWAGVQKGFRAVIAGFDGKDPLVQKATAAAILFDKLALMRGEATARTETRDTTTDDHERDLLNVAIRNELSRRTDERAAQDAVVGSEAPGAETPAG